ncbi:DinB superfamily [Chthonomonas calidirosea]|uniref:DinB family protein n=1 Tax=Chthonomonas calidirosea TaxID=454171 RepID=UPI0006DD52C5|nr:DinB family protein [Chthonomonas calidirosea]CEK15038.1 DinB superfamily [Chthonomonas calidirosea]
MAQSLLAFLISQSKKAYRSFLQEIETITPQEALYHRHPHWPPQQWGIGQDGSIAGIVYHVAAWKQAALSLLRGEDALSPMEHPETLPPPSIPWPEVCNWYREIGAVWCNQLEKLHESDLDRSCFFFDDKPITLSELISEIMLHDVQHASQIAYLRQHLRAEEITR